MFTAFILHSHTVSPHGSDGADAAAAIARREEDRIQKALRRHNRELEFLLVQEMRATELAAKQEEKQLWRKQKEEKYVHDHLLFCI